MESNHRLTALRMIDGLCEMERQQDLLELEICVRVFVVPHENEEEFNASLAKSDNSTGQRAHWSVIQFRVCALLDSKLEKRHSTERSSFLDKVSTTHSRVYMRM